MPCESDFKFSHKMAESSRVGSYKCEFIDDVHELLICGLCKHAANGPSMTTCCGELFCQACIASAIDEKRPCPSCQEPTFSTFLNPRYERDIKNLCVHCTMKDCGCEWTGKLKQLDAHLDVEKGDCEYVDIECPEKCGQQIQKCQLDTHIANECPNRDFVCMYCDFKAAYNIVTNEHWPECQNYPVPCPNRCGIGAVKRNLLEDHLNTCPLQVVECDFSYAGCNKKLQRQDMEKHVEESTQEHLVLMAAASVRLQEQRDEFQKKLQEQRDEFQGYLEQKERETAEQLKQKDREIKAVDVRLQQSVRQNEHLQKSLQEMQAATNEKLQQLEAEQRQQTQQLQRRLDELQTKQDRQLRAVNIKITQIERKVCDCENYNFPLVKLKLEDRDVQCQFLFTHSGGYKFCFVVSKRGTHVSVKLEAHSGPSDDSLQWPAKCTITLQLVNQHRDQDHVTVTKKLEWEQPWLEEWPIPALGHRKASGKVRRLDRPVSILISDKFITCDDLCWNAERQTQYIKDDHLHFKVIQIFDRN